ncbi:MAG: hypothetical protein CMF96_02430 [Candidatus Marinimicrobia bacterium]|nr:hypothetical protein [Candidatus Neomarinimicrobiota bacterium]|tara:strand:- start:7089 stop:7457 length:369 start_codon:yes stop_codon:yes gene_type:complete
MRFLLILVILFFFIGCKSEAELTLERGIQYYEWAIESNGSNVDKAVIEFKQVVRLLSDKLPNISRNEVMILSKAHHNLAVCYLKKEWLDAAEQEARNAFKLMPIEENKATLSVVILERKNKN